jgi:hypothetical protein
VLCEIQAETEEPIYLVQPNGAPRIDTADTLVYTGMQTVPMKGSIMWQPVCVTGMWEISFSILINQMGPVRSVQINKAVVQRVTAAFLSVLHSKYVGHTGSLTNQ